MVPTVLLPPATESTDQFTPVALMLVSLEVNCCVPPGKIHGLRGAMVTLPVGRGGDPEARRSCEQPVANETSATQAAQGQTDRRHRRTG